MAVLFYATNAGRAGRRSEITTEEKEGQGKEHGHGG